MAIYLYVKTHNITGLKYLGKTEKDPLIYRGSGKYWLRHIYVHGYDVTTQILLKTESKRVLKDTGIFFSKLWNVVEDPNWANLKEECGDGGRQSESVIDAMRKTIRSKKASPTFVEPTKDTVWINDGFNHKRIKECDLIPAGWVVGLLVSSQRGKIWINDGLCSYTISKEEEIPEGYSLGNLGKRGHKNPQFGSKWYNDGTTNYKIPPGSDIPEHLTKGRLMNMMV